MTFRRSTRLLATAVLGAALTLTASPAHAVTFVHDDAVGDARSIEFDDPESNDLGTERPDDPRADVVQLRVRHGRSRLVMRVEVVGMTRTGSLEVGPVFTIRTSGRTYFLDLSAVRFREGPRRPDTRPGDTLRDVDLRSKRGRKVRCRGLFTDFDFTGDVALVSVPRRCVGSPRRVQVGAGMVHVLGNGETVFADDALRDNRLRDNLALSAPIRSGPRRGR